MESNKKIAYDIDKSSQRMDDIINNHNSNFCDCTQIPSRDQLTYNNGYYVNVTSIFIDIVKSSDMTDSHKRPTLAKMYRSFISECVAILNSYSNCKEINIHGDCVWGVFDTPHNSDIDEVFFVAATVNSVIKVLNYKLAKKGYSQISIGIGIDNCRALMGKAGYSGSSLNEVIWMGDVVNSASHICNKAGRGGREPIIVSANIYNKLNNRNQKFFESYMDSTTWVTYYETNVSNGEINLWYSENCK